MVDHNESVLGDNATDDDKLGFAEPAARLADKIARFPADTPMVVGVEGKWGEGKSSFLLMMKKHWREQACLAPTGFWEKLCQFFQEKVLRKKPARQIKLVEFDPWWFSGKENLLDKLLKELEGQEPWLYSPLRSLLKSLEKKASTDNVWLKSKLEVVALLLASGVSSALNPMLDWLGDSVSNAVKPWLKSGQTALLVLGLFWLIKLGLRAIVAKLAPPEGFDARKKKLKTLLRKDRFQRVVFIDDLDRLPADELQEMFRVIKSVANFPNVIYVLAYDRKVVSAALDKFHPGRGELFLEKIVQMPFPLPEPTQHARSKAYEELFLDLPIWQEACKSANMVNAPDWRDLIFSAMIPNLRQAKRLRDALLHSQEYALKIKPDVYIFLESLRLHNKDMHEKLCRAMLEFRDYPRSSIVAIETFNRSTQKDNKALSSRTESQERWMHQTGLLDEIFSLAPPKMIECIAFFTKTPFAKPDGSIYEYRLRSMLTIGGVDSGVLEKNEICRAFRCYLQAKYSEDDPTDTEIEKILGIENKEYFVKFIDEWPLMGRDTSHVVQHAISSYLHKLPISEKSERLPALCLLAQLAAGVAEDNMCSNAIGSGKSMHPINMCESVFLAVRQYIPGDITHDGFNAQWLDQYIENNAPLFGFYYLQNRGVLDHSIIRAIFVKYRPLRMLALLDTNPSLYCMVILHELFCRSAISISNGLPEWLAEMPDQEALSKEQNNHLMRWMLDSLQKEALSSKLFDQPKLTHLIEPLRQKLIKDGDTSMSRLLEQILQAPSPAN